MRQMDLKKLIELNKPQHINFITFALGKIILKEELNVKNYEKLMN